MVLSKAEEYPSKEISKIVGSCEASVNSWLKRFGQLGLQGLHIQKGRGRKPVFTKAHVNCSGLLTSSNQLFYKTLQKILLSILL